MSAKLRSRLPQIAAELAGKMDAVAAAGAETIAAQAKARVPVDTGKLRDAIHVERRRASEYAVVAGDRSAFYGHIIEHGGVRIPPHPFLVPAFEESREGILDIARTVLRTL